jgi:hypothetical protein
MLFQTAFYMLYMRYDRSKYRYFDKFTATVVINKINSLSRHNIMLTQCWKRIPYHTIPWPKLSGEKYVINLFQFMSISDLHSFYFSGWIFGTVPAPYSSVNEYCEQIVSVDPSEK